MHAERGIVLPVLSVRLSVCLSVTLWHCMEMNAHIVKSFHHLVGTWLVF